MNFEGRHIVVTGASTGIGLETAKLLAERGAKVTLIARSGDLLQQAAAKIGGNTAFAVADIGDKDQLLSAFDKAEAENGPITGLFANAGTGGAFAPIQDADDDTFENVLRTNLTSVYWAIKRVLPGMIEHGRGAMLVTGSLASERGMANNAAYVASKHGVLGLARAVALEAAPHGVRCNCIVPGFIDTPMLAGLPADAAARMAAQVPQRRIGTPQEMARTAAFLLSDEASHITGQSLAVDGGVLGTLTVQ